MDRRKLAAACAEIERKGMSVLAFLREMGTVSPWGTWYRLQIEELNRERHQIRDGKGNDEMRKLTLENRKKAVEIALAGGNYLGYLKDCGAENPSASWAYIRKCLQVKDPEIYDTLTEKMKQEKKAETVVFQGKVYEKAEAAEDGKPEAEHEDTRERGENMEEGKKHADDMEKLRIENAELIQRILKLEGQLAKEIAYNDALVKAIRFNYPNERER